MEKILILIIVCLISIGANFAYAGQNSNQENLNAQLLEASKKGQEEVVKLFIKKGADVNAQDSNGYTPLALACHIGNIEIANILAAAGAKDSLPTAAARGDIKAVKKLLNKKNVNTKANTPDEDTALTFASAFGHTEIVKLLLKKGADVNLTDKNGKSALSYAANHNNIEIVKFLIDKGANLNLRANNGKTALDYAKEKNNTEIVALLKAAGAKE